MKSQVLSGEMCCTDSQQTMAWILFSADLNRPELSSTTTQEQKHSKGRAFKRCWRNIKFIPEIVHENLLSPLPLIYSSSDSVRNS